MPKRTADLSGIEPAPAGVVHRIMASFRSMKTWVQIWLLCLGVVTFAGFAFLHEPAAIAILAGVAGSVLVNSVLLIWLRGFSRIHAMGHIPFFTPSVVVVILRLTTSSIGDSQLTHDSDPAAFVYAIVAFALFAICLLFDIYDSVNVWRGETYVMGSKEAYEAGASNLSVVVVADDLYFTRTPGAAAK